MNLRPRFSPVVPLALLIVLSLQSASLASARALSDPLPEQPSGPARASGPLSPGADLKVELAPAQPHADSAGRMPAQVKGMSQIISEADSAVRARGGARADNAQLFLTWNAPWGRKRAQQARMPACADSTLEDTLYFSMLTGRTGERFTGFTGQLLVRATGADTLGTWWHMASKGGENPGSLRMEWAALAPWADRQPFRNAGQGFVLLEHTPTVARLRMVYAVPYDQSAPIAADTVYTLARLIFKHRPERRLKGCEQPVVIEWAESSLAFGPKDEPVVRRGERFVAFSGPLALIEPFRGARVESWKPKPPTKR